MGSRPPGPVQTAMALRGRPRWLWRCRPRPYPFRRPSMAGGRRVGGTSYRHPHPAEARTGRAERPHCAKAPASRGAVERRGRYSDHPAPKRRPPSSLWREVVVLATPSPARMPGRPTLEAAGAKRLDWDPTHPRQPTATTAARRPDQIVMKPSYPICRACSTDTISRPSGSSEIGISLKLARPSGIPMIVRQSAIPVRR